MAISKPRITKVLLTDIKNRSNPVAYWESYEYFVKNIATRPVNYNGRTVYRVAGVWRYISDMEFDYE